MLSLCLSLLAAAPLHQDPGQDPLERIRRNTVLGRLKLEEIEGAAPFRLYHQVPGDDAPAQRVQVQALFAPWLAALARHFERDLGPALGLTGPMGLEVVVAARGSNFRSLQSTLTRRIPAWERCAWQPQVRALVTYHEARERTPPTAVRRGLLRHAGLRLLLDRSRAGEEPVGLWALEGLAAAIAEHRPGDAPEALGGGAPPSGTIAYLSSALLDERARRAFLLPLADLAGCAGPESRHLALSRTTLAAGIPAPEEEQADHVVRAQAELWVHYLAYRPGAAQRAGLLRYVRGVLAGRGDVDALRAALGVDPASLDAPFAEWAVALARAEAARPAPAPEAPISSAVDPGRGGAQSPPAERPAEQPAPADPAPSPPPGPRAWPLEGARHPALILSAPDLAGQLASALGRAVEGELAAALDFLDRVRAVAPPAEAERLTVERERLAAVRALRERFLASLVGTSKRLRLVEGDQVLASPVESIEAGVVRLGRNRHDLESIPLDSIGAADLRASLGRLAADEAPLWLVAYLELLAGDPGWPRTLEDDGPEARGLREHGLGLWDLLPAAALRRELALLARAPLPEGRDELRGLLERSGALAPSLAQEQAAGARAALRALASEAAEALFELHGIQLALRGEVVHLDGGRIRLRHDFDDPAQLEDFVDAPDLAPWRYQLSLRDATPRCVVEGGALVLSGSLTRRLRLPVAQATIRYGLKFTDPGSLELGQLFYLLSGLDPTGLHYARAVNTHDLFVLGADGLKEHIDDERGVTVHEPIQVVVQHHEGGAVTLDGDGHSIRLDGRGVGGNGIGFQVHSNHAIRVLSFEVEGLVTDADRAAVRGEWVAGELARLGF